MQSVKRHVHTLVSGFNEQENQWHFFGITRRQLIAVAGGLSPRFAIGRTSGAAAQNAPLTSQGGSDGGPYGRSVAEVSASVVPVNYAVPVGNVLRYGAIGDGHTDDRKAVTGALEVSRFGGSQPVVLPSGYKFTISRYIEVHSNTVIRLWGNIAVDGAESRAMRERCC
jgi:hypothetical protein